MSYHNKTTTGNLTLTSHLTSYPTCLKTPLNPASPSIVSRIDVPELADDERCRGLGRICALGTSRKPFELDELRFLRPASMMAASRAVGGASDAEEDEDDSSDEVEALEMVGTMMVVGYAESLCCAKGVLSF